MFGFLMGVAATWAVFATAAWLREMTRREQAEARAREERSDAAFARSRDIEARAELDAMRVRLVGAALLKDERRTNPGVRLSFRGGADENEFGRQMADALQRAIRDGHLRIR